MGNSSPKPLLLSSQAPSLQRNAVRRWTRHPFLLALFLLVNFMSIALPSFGVGGLPVRAFLAALITFYTFTVYHRTFLRVVVKFRLILYLFIGFAFLGTIVSLGNFTDLSTIIRQVVEIHVQATLTLLAAAVLVELCGPAPVLWMFAVPVGLSVLFAFGQALNIDAAWAIRSALGSIQYELVDKSEAMALKSRPLGLSYSPIALATQLCLCFAGYGILRERRRQLFGRWSAIDPMLIGAALVFFAICLLSGNRSPMLGMLLFVLFYMARQKRAGFWLILLPLGLLVLALIGPMLLDTLQESGSRVTSVEDKSAMGRVALYYYGTLLFVNHPFGYGLSFDPTAHWEEYWEQIAPLPNSGTIQEYPLHNYILSMLNFYGIGILILAPGLYVLYRKYKWTVIYFIPYILHIMFHNSGPFWSDQLVWIILAIAAGVMREMQEANSLTADDGSFLSTEGPVAIQQQDSSLG